MIKKKKLTISILITVAAVFGITFNLIAFSFLLLDVKGLANSIFPLFFVRDDVKLSFGPRFEDERVMFLLDYLFLIPLILYHFLMNFPFVVVH